MNLLNYYIASPWALWFLLIIPALLAWYVLTGRRKPAAMRFSSLQGVSGVRNTWRSVMVHVLFGLRMVALTTGIIALSRPQLLDHEEKRETKGIDIVIAIDVSASMLARDFKPDRLEAAKAVAKEFIGDRPNDRIGIVVFAGEAFAQCPLTTDHQVLTQLMDEVRTGVLEDGTAIGSGLGTAVNRLKDSKSTSKVVILLTDGVNNRGELDPRTAAMLAAQNGIRVHTIGVGTTGKAYAPTGITAGGRYVFDYVDVEIDEALLNEVSSETGGRYYRATDNESLRSIYDEIDNLEKSIVAVSTLPKAFDLFPWLVMAALGLVVVELFVRYGVVRTLT